MNPQRRQILLEAASDDLDAALAGYAWAKQSMEATLTLYGRGATISALMQAHDRLKVAERRVQTVEDVVRLLRGPAILAT